MAVPKSDWKTVALISERPSRMSGLQTVAREVTDMAREARRSRQAAGVSSILDFGGPSGSSIPSVLASNSAISSFLYTISRADKIQLFRYWCFTDPFTPITMEDGTEKPLCEISPGDRVITALGSATTVVQPLVRDYDGEVIDLDLNGTGKRLIGVTAEHPLWVVRKHKVTKTCNSFKDQSHHRGTTFETIIHIDFSPEWVEAGDVQPGDFLVVPKTVGVKNGDFSVEKVRLLGYYLAKGNPFYRKLTDGSSIVEISWQFCSKECDLIQEVVDLVEVITGEPPSIYGPYEGATRATVEVRTRVGNLRHVELSRWILHHGGKYSYNKKLSKEAFYLEDELTKNLIACWLSGDGTSVSSDLIHQFYLMMTRVGMVSSEGGYHSKGKERQANTLLVSPVSYNLIADYVNRHEIFRKFKHKKYNVDGNMLLSVKGVTKRKFIGQVFNIETDGFTYDEQSFLAYGLVTHNCHHDTMVGRAIDLHSELPMSRVTIGPPKGESPRQNREITRIYESMCDRMDLMSLLMDISREMWLCFPLDSRVKVRGGLSKPLGEIQVGDEVLTKIGRYRPVLAIREKEVYEEICVIHASGLTNPLRVTVEHRIFTDQGEKAAGDIAPGDQLYFCPDRSEVTDLSLTDNHCELIGLYLTYGSLGSNFSVIFSFPHDDFRGKYNKERVIRLTQDLFPGNIEYGSNYNLLNPLGPYDWVDCRTISAYHFFKSECSVVFPDGVSSKRLSETLTLLPIKQQFILLKAWVAGCGRMDCISADSPILGEQLYHLLARIGPDLCDLLESSSKPELCWERPLPDGRIPLKVQFVERVHYQGKVRDLTVNEDNSYVVENATVHNCGDVYVWMHWNEEIFEWDDVYVLPVEYLHSIIHPFNRKKEIIFFAKPLVDTAAIRRLTDRDLYMVADTDVERLYEALGDSVPEELKEALNYGEAVPLNTNWRRGSYCVHLHRNRPPNEEYGECLSASTRVLSERGYLKIQDMVETHCGNIQTEYGPRSFDWVQENGVQELRKITTKTHREINVTPSHRFRVMGKDGILHWKRTRDLEMGDYLLCQRGDGGLLPEDRGGETRLWEALGLMWGDGSWINKGTQHCWFLPQGEEETLDWLKNWLEGRGYSELKGRLSPAGPKGDCSGLNEVGNPSAENQLYRVSLNLNSDYSGVKTQKRIWVLTTVIPEFNEILSSWSEKGNWRHGGFPEGFWKLGKKQMAAFLRGLFTTATWYGTGKTENYRIRYTSTYKNVADDTCRALLLLGIISRVDLKHRDHQLGGKRESYGVTLLGRKSVSRYCEKIGFLLQRKNDRLIYRYNFPKKNQKIADGYPYSTALIKRIFPSNLYRSKRGVGDTGESDSVSTTIRLLRSGKQHLLADTMVEKILEKSAKYGQDKHAIALFQEYVNNDWWFDRVESIATIPSEVVYDPVNTATQSYVSEGMVSHNSLLERCMDTLLRIENIKNANFQISSRNMSPKHLISAPGVGGDKLDELRAQVDLALLENVDVPIVVNFEVTWQVIGASDRLLNTDSEYQTLRQDLATGLGTTVDMLTGAATYGGQRITLEVMNTQYLTFRDNISKFVSRNLFRPVAFAQGHYTEEEIEMWPRVRPEAIEVGDVLIEERDGHLRRKRNKINVIWMHSTLRWNRISIRDNAEIYDQLFQLYQKGSLAVRYLLDLHNIDPEENSQAMLEDIGTPRDPVFNDFTRALYTATDVPQNIINQTDFTDRIIRGLKLGTKSQPAAPGAAPGGGMGGGFGGGGLSDVGGGFGGGPPMGPGGAPGVGLEEGGPGMPGGPGAGPGGVGATSEGDSGGPATGGAGVGLGPVAASRRTAGRVNTHAGESLPGRRLDVRVVNKLRDIVATRYHLDHIFSPLETQRVIEKIEQDIVNQDRLLEGDKKKRKKT
jgi:intein/homing endonuclease